MLAIKVISLIIIDKTCVILSTLKHITVDIKVSLFALLFSKHIIKGQNTNPPKLNTAYKLVKKLEHNLKTSAYHTSTKNVFKFNLLTLQQAQKYMPVISILLRKSNIFLKIIFPSIKFPKFTIVGISATPTINSGKNIFVI